LCYSRKEKHGKTKKSRKRNKIKQKVDIEKIKRLQSTRHWILCRRNGYYASKWNYANSANNTHKRNIVKHIDAKAIIFVHFGNDKTFGSIKAQK
jgi:hypothetical protein